MKKAKYLLTIIFLLFLTVIACLTANSAQASLSSSFSEKISSQDRNLKNNSASLPVATAELVQKNKILQDLSPKSTSNYDLPINIHWDSEQADNVFRTMGSASAVYTTDANGKKVLQYFKITDDQPGQAGGLVLRTPYSSRYSGNTSKFPATMDVTFDIRSTISKSSNGPGNGFAIFNCPKIQYGEYYKEGSFPSPTKVPQMPKDQTMFSLGQAGANLGVSDLVGAAGAFIANKGVSKEESIPGDGKLYGADSHRWTSASDHQLYSDRFGYDKDKYLSLDSNKSCTGGMYTWPDDRVLKEAGVTAKHDPGAMDYRGFLITRPYTDNIANGQWYRVRFTLNDSNISNIKVWNVKEITDNPNAKAIMDFSQNLNQDIAYTSLNFYPKMYLKLTASTGLGFSEQDIRNLHGNINVAHAGTTIAQKVDTNGKPIDDATKDYPNVESQSIDEPINYTGSDNSKWVLSHVTVQNSMTDGTLEGKKKISSEYITNDGGVNWICHLPGVDNVDSNDVISRDVDFVYRRVDKKPQIKIDLFKNGSSQADQVTLQNGDSVKVNLTLTNPLDGPNPWNKVSAWIVKPKNLDFTKDSNDNKVSLNKNGYLVADFGDFSSNENKTVSYTLKNNSNSKVDLNNDTENLEEQTIYLYDQSPENFDDDGQLLQSSYYYDENTCDGPLGSSTSLPNFNTYTDLDYGNYIPRWGSKVERQGKVVFHYWDIDDPDSKVSMDPSADKVPLKEINDLKPKTVTGDLGTPVVGSLPNGTDAVQQAAGISNPQAPAPAFPGYKYLGYYEYDGTQSTFHSYYPSSAPDVGPEDSPDLSNGNVDTTFKTGEMHDPPQSIAFIYRKRSLDGALSLQVPSELQFGSHLTTKRKFSANDSYQVTINDFRNNRGLPLNQKNGNYQLSVQTTNELSGKTDNKINNVWLTFGDPTITSNKSNDYSPNINKVSKIFSSNDKLNILPIGKSDKHLPLAIMNSNQFGSFKLVWSKENINLNVGTNQKIKSDSYDAQITWQLTDSISN